MTLGRVGCVAVVSWLGVAACGGETAIGTTRSTDEPGDGGRSAGGSRATGGEPSSGGSTGNGGSVSTGGFAGGGTPSSGGNDNSGGRTPPPPLPDGSAWEPPFPVSAGGWRESTDRFCPHRYGRTSGAKVWSDAEAVFALFAPERCPLDARGPCNGEGTSLYVNAGAGWRLLYDEADDPTSLRLHGFLDGDPIVYGGTPCHLLTVDRSDGRARCAWESSLDLNDNVVHMSGGGWAYALTRSGLILEVSIRSYMVRADLDVERDSMFSGWNTISAAGNVVMAAGEDGRFASVFTGAVKHIDAGTTADFSASWQFSEEDVWRSSAASGATRIRSCSSASRTATSPATGARARTSRTSTVKGSASSSRALRTSAELPAASRRL